MRRLESWAANARRRRATIKEALVSERGGRCEDCGYDTTVRALEFHHREAGDKSFSLGGFVGGIDRARREADKCVLVCANCHRIRHATVADAADHPVTRSRRRVKERAVAAMGRGCRGCGRAAPPAALEFHHRDAADKRFAISADGALRSWVRVEAELKKCVLLCANCHREVHAGVRRLTEDERPYRTCQADADPLHKRCA